MSTPNRKPTTEPLARSLTEAMAEAVQVRLLLSGFEPSIPASELIAFLSVKQRALDLEIRLRDLAGQHPMREQRRKRAVEPPANVH